MTPDL
jgi:CRP-like cAMP-binding protein